MEQFNRSNPDATQQSRASSVSSYDSVKRSAYSDYTDSTSIDSRPAPTKPSYMNAVPARKPVTPRLGTDGQSGVSATKQAVQAPAVKGLLLLFVAAQPHSKTVNYLEMMIRRSPISSINIIGNAEQETELKQLKMDIFALLGRLRVEISVQLDLQQSWGESEVSTAVDKAVGADDKVHAVLCVPDYHTNGGDILALEERDLDLYWRSVSFIHTVAKLAVPKFRINNHMQRTISGLLLVTGPTESFPTSILEKSACDAMIKLLANATNAGGPTVAYADDVLIPELEPEPVKSSSGHGLAIRNGDADTSIGGYTAPESPTKLWNMWALQDERGAGV